MDLIERISQYFVLRDQVLRALARNTLWPHSRGVRTLPRFDQVSMGFVEVREAMAAAQSTLIMTSEALITA